MKYLLPALTLLSSLNLMSQLNMTYRGNITYDQELSDIWGYVAPDESEYAIVGVYDGVSIVDVSDPENPTELFFFEGAQTTWRDIKTWGEYAYVTNETSDGIMVIDLGDLPSNASAYDWTPTISGLGTISSCHNIWIDEFGYAYLAGCNINNGGMIYVDCFTTPGQPSVSGVGPAVYSHDVFTRGNVAYSSEVYEGVFTIYDVSDKNNTQILGSRETGGNFTHNAWLSDDSDFLFTTDEIANGPVGSYDVSDPTDVEELDQFRPLETLGDGVIPHNVHVWDDWIIISYYTDGCILVDGSNPSNLIEVGNFDTFIPSSTGFNGAWGAYPYLPSGLVLISDIGNGMYVLEPNYVRACWLEGNIRDADTQAGLVGAEISIESTIVVDQSGNQGAYATGYAIAGTYDITVTKAGYNSATVTVDLTNGEVTELDVDLEPFESFSIGGDVITDLGGTEVPNAMLVLSSDDFFLETQANGQGQFNLNGVFADTYDVTVGAWGYVTECFTLDVTSSTSSLVLELSEGFYDDFSMDFGWTSSATSPTGEWERVDPLPTSYFGSASNPGSDVSSDCNDFAYITGNGNASVGADDVDDGSVTLISPEFPVDVETETSITFKRWFANYDDTVANDELVISLLDENDNETILQTIDAGDMNGQWVDTSIPLTGIATSTGMYRLKLFTDDDMGNGSIVEAGIDEFGLEMTTGLQEVDILEVLEVWPNPSSSNFSINVDPDSGILELKLSDSLGRLILSKTVRGGEQLEIGETLSSGLYLLQLTEVTSGEVLGPVKLVKN